MPEREPQNSERQRPDSAQESSSLHEQGGLVPEHWQFIAEKLPRKYKIKKFAKAVIDGIVDEENSGQYLGRRHWWELADYFHKHTTGHIPELTVGHTSRYRIMAEEIIGFSRIREATTEVTIDDKLARALIISTPIGSGKTNSMENWLTGREETGLFWSRVKRGWYYRYVRDPREKRDKKPRTKDNRHFRKVEFTRDWIVDRTLGASILTKRFLLDPNTDIRKIKHKSPGALVRLARSQCEAIAQRTGLSWEKPIPEAT